MVHESVLITMSTDKNKVVHSQGREIVASVIAFCDAEKESNSFILPVTQATKRAAEATGKSVSFIKKLRRELKVSQESGTKLNTPGKKRNVGKRIALDDMSKCIIRRKVQEFYSVKKQVPTLWKLRAVLQEAINYEGSKEHLRQTLHAIGFRFKKCQNKRKLLMERNDIVFKRSCYLRSLRANDKLGEKKRPVIYLDETYIHPSYTVKKCWQDDDTDGVLTSDSAGQRWIIVHAGSEEGFVPGALCMFKSKTKSGDYHDEMNSGNFTKWLKMQLLPNITEASIIVMDNAPYHSQQINKPPTSNSRKEEMKAWLSQNNIEFPLDAKKCELLDIIRRKKSTPTFAVDEFLKSAGHTVARLPPYHCDLNPIEYIWSTVKRRVAENNVAQSNADIEQLTKEAFASVTGDEWKKVCGHVDELRSSYWVNDALVDEVQEQLIIRLGNESDSDSDSSTELDGNDSSSDSVASGISGIEALE